MKVSDFVNNGWKATYDEERLNQTIEEIEKSMENSDIIYIGYNSVYLEQDNLSLGLYFDMSSPKTKVIDSRVIAITVYTKEELISLSNVCKEHNLYFYIDGARLGCALTSKMCDYTIAEMAQLCDAFYIGGTKNGLILGEALVVTNESLNNDIRYAIKCHGGMYAKGFVNGIMFNELFSNDLFFNIIH